MKKWKKLKKALAAAKKAEDDDAAVDAWLQLAAYEEQVNFCIPPTFGNPESPLLFQPEWVRSWFMRETGYGCKLVRKGSWI